MHILEEFIKHHELMGNKVDTDYINRYIEKHGEETLMCKCGKFKKIKGNGILFYYCGSPECHHFYGKKRPDHAKLMKEKAAAGLISSCYRPGRVNTFVNTLEWKKKVLSNKSIDFSDSASEEEIEKLFREVVSKNCKSRNNKISFIKTMYERYSSEYDLDDIEVKLDHLDSCSDEELSTLKRICNSIKTIEANKKGTGLAKRFKTSILSNFKFNLSNPDYIKTRSSYEVNYIDFFEKNKIYWNYETIKIKTSTGFYVPDFEFYYRDKKYLLEVKGYLLDVDEYYDKKLKYAKSYADENNYIFLFSYDPRPESIQNLLSKEFIYGNN
jgi:hypothetical protein